MYNYMIMNQIIFGSIVISSNFPATDCKISKSFTELWDVVQSLGEIRYL